MSDKDAFGGNNLIYDTSNCDNVLLRSVQWNATVWTLWYALERRHPYARAFTFAGEDAAGRYDKHLQIMVNINRLMYPRLFDTSEEINKIIVDAATAFEAAINAQQAATNLQRMAKMENSK